MHVAAGTAIVTEGAAGADFFVILSGNARVDRHGQKVAELGPGGFFGDLALLDRAPRNATVIAMTDMDLAKLGQRGFDGLLERVPGFAKKLLAGLARRLRQEDAKSVELKSRTAVGDAATSGASCSPGASVSEPGIPARSERRIIG